jgi:hypothetical protein
MESGRDYVFVNGMLYEVCWCDHGLELRAADGTFGALPQLVATGLSLGLNLIGGAQARKQQESMRDSKREEAYAQLRNIKEAVLNCQMNPDQAVSAAQAVVDSYYAWADQALTIPSVRQSAENFRNQPGGFNDDLRIISDAAAKARQTCNVASAAVNTATSGLSTSVGGIPLWALGAGAVALLALSGGKR